MLHLNFVTSLGDVLPAPGEPVEVGDHQGVAGPASGEAPGGGGFCWCRPGRRRPARQRHQARRELGGEVLLATLGETRALFPTNSPLTTLSHMTLHHRALFRAGLTWAE